MMHNNKILICISCKKSISYNKLDRVCILSRLCMHCSCFKRNLIANQKVIEKDLNKKHRERNLDKSIWGKNIGNKNKIKNVFK